jgi:UDP-glucose 4-epimerase
VLFRSIFDVNHAGTIRVAEACLTCRCPLIFISTTSIYGTQSGEVDEDCAETELRPQSPYAESKLKAERELAELGRTRGLDFVICRFGTIFGVSPGMRFHTAINKFCWQAANGQPLTVWRSAFHQQRPYLDLDDAVRALIFLVSRRHYDRRVYNALTLNAATCDIVEAIRRHLPALQTVYTDSAIMNQLSYRVLCRRITDLGFEFRGTLGDGIARTLALLGDLHG